MASDSGRRKSLRLDLAHASALESPGIAALFLIRFDIKAGCAAVPELLALTRVPTDRDQCAQIRDCLETVFARRCATFLRRFPADEADVRGETVELGGVVEYKSLPSGLHNVTEDLVYASSSPNAHLSTKEDTKNDLTLVTSFTTSMPVSALSSISPPRNPSAMR